MSKRFFDSGISLDGFFARDNRGPKNPMCGVSGQIHLWMFNQRAFWEYLGMEGGKEDGRDGKFIRETIERTGVLTKHIKLRSAEYLHAAYADQFHN